MKTLSPLKSIRRFCIWCMGGQVRLVEGCTAPGCALFRYRMGRTGRVGRTMAPDERAQKAAALKKWRSNKVLP